MQYESENDKNVQETQAKEYKNRRTPVSIQQTHDKWIATQVEILRRRRKEAKEGRQRTEREMLVKQTKFSQL
jgi:hypothetical protein